MYMYMYVGGVAGDFPSEMHLIIFSSILIYQIFRLVYLFIYLFSE